MRKFGVFGAVLCALFAFGALVASAAFAVEDEAVWLVHGELVLVLTPAESEGEILLVVLNTANSAVLNEIKCSGIFDGSIGPNGEDEITEVLTLLQVKVGKDQLLTGGGNELTGEPVTCEVTFDAGETVDCETGATNAQVWPANLPWHTQISLMLTAPEDILDVFTGTVGEPGFEVLCLKTLLGISAENLCEGPTSVLLENNPAGVPPSVLAWFNAATVASERANCTLTGEHSAEVISDVSSDIRAIGAQLEWLETSVDDCEEVTCP
jgi:hypothetical protein